MKYRCNEKNTLSDDLIFQFFFFCKKKSLNKHYFSLKFHKPYKYFTYSRFWKVVKPENVLSKKPKKKKSKKKMTTPEIKKASTVIIVSPFKSAHYNWKFLMVKRHSKARFMANNYVFPGGVEVFQNKKSKKKKMEFNFQHNKRKNPIIMKNGRN